MEGAVVVVGPWGKGAEQVQRRNFVIRGPDLFVRLEGPAAVAAKDDFVIAVPGEGDSYRRPADLQARYFDQRPTRLGRYGNPPLDAPSQRQNQHTPDRNFHHIRHNEDFITNAQSNYKKNP